MSNLLVCFLLLIFSGTISAKLVYMTELFRHGARYPVSSIFDGNATKNYHGQETTVGYRQQYLLGSYLRNDYISKMGFLNSTLDPREIEVFTEMGSVDRCIYSLLAHALGLYPA